MNEDHFPTPEKPLRIGTRKSPLAMVQAQMAASAIRAAHRLPDGSVTIIPMLASGDRIQDRPLAEIGGKALWTKELERALLHHEIDIAVHSMKDVETLRDEKFCIAAMLPRADMRDRLVGAASVAALAKAARVGTSSPRRAAQLLHMRPDLQITSIRGNVATRLAKIEAGEMDATLLAAAGLDRLSMPDTGSAIEIDDMLPAASQGAIGIDCLSDRGEIRALMQAVDHEETNLAVSAERAFLAALGGDCHSPVAAHAELRENGLLLRAEILREDGSERQQGSRLIIKEGDAAVLAGELLAKASDALAALFAPCAS